MSKEEEDPDIAIIKARKMKELREQATALENARMKKQQQEEEMLRPKKLIEKLYLATYTIEEKKF